MKAITKILGAMKEAFSTFAGSNGSIEGKLIDVVGTYADSEAVERQNTLDVIQIALANQKVTRKEYYRRKSVAYQQGDTVVYDPINLGAYYENIDESKQIIKQSYIVGDFPTFTNLVNAIDDSTGHLRQLTISELSSFSVYFNAFQPLGMSIQVQSLNVALIRDNNIVIYVRSGSDMQKTLDEIKDNLKAHEQTLREFNEVTLTEIEDVIQKSNSVVAVGWDKPLAFESLLSGGSRTIAPSYGVFNLLTGVFIFDTELTLSNLKILE